jgi:hypothetical protein
MVSGFRCQVSDVRIQLTGASVLTPHMKLRQNGTVSYD